MSKSKKIKTTKEHSYLGKKPKTVENPNSYYNWTPSWNFAKCDFEHQKWSLKSNNVSINDVIDKLISFEHMKWKEIIVDNKKKNHWIECSELSNDAQRRIKEKDWDFDEIFSLRLTGVIRLFGLIQNGVFYIIWYDPNHEICPSHKKHT